MRFVWLSFVLLVVSLPAVGTEATSTLPTYVAEKIISGNEIGISENKILRLGGIEEPFQEPKKWRDAARETLGLLALGRALNIENISIDRYGRPHGQVYVLDKSGNKIWLQGEMLRRGLTFVYPPTGKEARLSEMLALESVARREKTGIWSDEAYADLAVDKTAGHYGRFAFVRGRISDVIRARGFVYIHFGDDWRATLTVAIAGHDVRIFRKAGIDPFELTGKTVRVRGWIKKNIGPMITLTDPAQMEVLAP